MTILASALVTAVIWMCCIFSRSGRVTAQNEHPVIIDATQFTSSEPLIQTSHNISIVEDKFMLDGVPLQILSGSVHYFRIPSQYWRDRLHKVKAAGLNSVSTYVEWSFHEPEERQYSFEGDRDVAQFIRLAAEEGLHVLLRPGPYICAERDLGGFPYWLLGKYPYIRLRTTDRDFIRESEIWLEMLFNEIKPLLFGNGGPIILVQVENEYGSYGGDVKYMETMRDIMLKHVGTNALLYTTDGNSASYFIRGSVKGALTTIDFGVGTDANSSFVALREWTPHGPLMNSEFYPGWLTHWGEHLQQVDARRVVATLRDMLRLSANVNFYMFHGGTNFEFTAGANIDGIYQPDITSYDYDAPISEAGDPTPKYFAIRNVLKRHNPDVEKIPPPTPSHKGAYGTIKVSPKVLLMSRDGRAKLGKKYASVTGVNLPSFEKLRQRAGLVLYETILKDAEQGLLKIQKPFDRVSVFVNGVYQGLISRPPGIKTLPLVTSAGSVLSLLTENQGRINFGSHINERKGIVSPVLYNNKTLNCTWEITGYPLEKIPELNRSLFEDLSISDGPMLYSGTFQLTEGELALDTFLDTTGWGKGYIWVNERNLGRYWPGAGPQATLYLPGVWLRPAPHHNSIHVLELEQAHPDLTLLSIDYPILNRTIIEY